MGNLLLAKSRINILVIAIFVLFSILALQLFRVQVVQAGSYQRKAANEMQSTRVIPAPRGEITDVNGIAFARSVSAITRILIRDFARRRLPISYLTLRWCQVEKYWSL